jgi:hypothetical protein
MNHFFMTAQYTDCPGSWEASAVIWQNTEKCNEGKVTADCVFPVSHIKLLYLG